VCYRIRGGVIEFLLVQTRGGRWTFPKGGVEPGLTHAQAAALEAYEEAGVHGRMEEASFTRYLRRKGGSSAAVELGVSAHLCEVLRLGPPQEFNRNRTCFPRRRQSGVYAKNARLITEPNWLGSWTGLWPVANDYAGVAQEPMQCKKCNA